MQRLWAGARSVVEGLYRWLRGLPMGPARWGLVALVPLLLGLFWWVWLPRVVLGRLEHKLAARDLRAEIGSVSVGFGGVEIHDARIRTRTPGLILDAETIAVHARPWQLLSGLSGVKRLELAHATLSADLHGPGLRELLARQSAKSTGSSLEKTERPALQLADLSIVVRDQAGELIVGKGLDVRVGATDWAVKIKQVRVGGEPGEVISLADVEAAGALAGRAPQVREATVGGAVLQWAPETEAQESDDTLPAARGRTVARLRAAAALRRQKAPGVQTSPSEPGHALWSDDAKVALKDARIVQGSGADTQEILSGLTVLLSAQGPHAMRVQVAGRSDDAGEIKLNLTVQPRALRAQGDVALTNVSLALFAPALPPLPFYQLEQTRLNARLSLTAEGLEQMLARGELEITELSFASEGLARVPVGPISMKARGEATWNPARRELNVKEMDAEVGNVRTSASGILAWPVDGYRVDATFQLHKSSCQEVLQAVPIGLLDEVAAVQLQGQFAAKLVAHVDAANLDATKLDFDIADTCKFTGLPPILDLLRFQQPFTHRVLEPDGQIFEFETGPGTPAWTPIDLISPFMLQAVVAHEDGRFFTHHGFAEPEIAVALSRNLKARAFRFGASTITMQLVKNVFLHRDKLLSRKVQEALITWWLETQWDKRHILELYLNVIEYGPAIYGLRNAAFHYFGTIPMNLTPAQAAFLASILPSPKTFHSLYDDGKLSNSMKSRLASFLRHMRARDRIDDEALAYGLEELENFTFYRPDQPPPTPPLIRGTAKSPPFDVPAVGIDAWDTFEVPDAPAEDGSFGSAP